MRKIKNVMEFIQVLKVTFGVEKWRGDIRFTKEEGNADMQVIPRYKQYTLRIHRNFFDADLTYQAETLIHEYCHLFNLPVANLVGEMREGNHVTALHLDDVLERANMIAEETIIHLLKNNDLRVAYKKYITDKKPSRSVKRGPKLRSKHKKKKTGTR